MKQSFGSMFLAVVLLSFGGASDAEDNFVAVGKENLPPDSPVLKTEAFEGKLPSYVSCSKGKISISGLRSQDGTHSLRWDWVPGDVLTFKTGPLGKINVWAGYGGYCRSTFGVNVFTETVSDGVMTYKWMSDDKVGARFDFPLIFKGWQRLCYHYTWESKLKDCNKSILEKTDRIVIEAPKEGKGGTVYFDSINFNLPIDWRFGREPVTKLWKPFEIAKDCKDPAILAPPTQQELDAVKQFLNRTPGGKTWTEKDMKGGVAIEQKFKDKYSLERLPDGRVIGKVIPNLSLSVGSDLNWLADRWRETSPSTDPKIKRRIEEAYFLLDDFFREAGAVPQGGLGDLSWYAGRAHASACFIMQEPLRRTGRLERVRNCLKYHWEYDKFFKLPEERQPMGMDYFYIDTGYLLKIALMHDTPSEIVSNLRAFSRRFSIDIINTVEVDGSVYHHGFYNFPYGGGGVHSMVNQIKQLSTTPFAVSREAFDKAKLAVMAVRWFCNLTDAPVSMHGRHPGRMGVDPKEFLSLAEAGRRYNNGKLDRELAAAYLCLAPNDASNPVLTGEGIAPEVLQGNKALNYAQLMGHRRGEWLAVVRGYSKYLPAQESYGKANGHGRFMGNGYLDILATGNPINIVDSGCDIKKGWDWRNLDGTTSYFAPYAKIANGNGTLSERSDVGFFGGLSHCNKNGIFVMPLHSHDQYTKSLPEGIKDDPKKFFSANKSYFFFDDRIVCIGSGITLPDSEYPVRTTLFQKNLTSTGMPIRVDARQVSEFPWKADLPPAGAHTLMDIQETGYYLPSGQKITVTREHQKSRDGHDEKDTEGNAATAWIEHGVRSEKVGYSYVVLLRTTPEKLARFANFMNTTADERPMLISRKDDEAHIVLDRPTRSWGCVFFKAQKFALQVPAAKPNNGEKNDPVFPFLSVAQPCLAMVEETADGSVAMTVCDPDLRLEKNQSTPATLSMVLQGEWKLKDGSSNIKIEKNGSGNSTLTITCAEGRSYLLTLIR